MSFFDRFEWLQPSPISSPREDSWQFNGWTIRIIRQPRRRSISISLKPHAPITIRTNQSVTRTEIESFLLQKKVWIEKHLYRFSQVKSPIVPNFQSGENFLFLGQFVTVKTTVTPLRKFFISCAQNDIWLHLPEGVTLPLESSIGLVCLRQFYLREAKKLLPNRVHFLAKKSGLQPKNIKIKLLKSRWGSCSSLGEISLNAFLVAAPTWVIDSVIIHELSHLQHMNHSKSFWSLVAQHAPRHKQADQWLNENLMGLIR